MTDDEIYFAFVNKQISDLLREKDPVLWGELHFKASNLYRKAVEEGEIDRV